ncbi:MAG: hypothetical protein ACD_49C00009G0051 [uncultured bacterium (gcode 4)]|uniref:Uncharacterized protein n=1 Tax=uncultured bacterium (gcode 4) TaxID=1234023 RepID=K2AYK2_9BACT|nr:MAG: hypothetical protein ACD_49C00009G0051 [uncultured bacterium (gcode 4)]
MIKLMKKNIKYILLFIIGSLLPVITFANTSNLDFKNEFWLPGFYEGDGIIKTENPIKFLFVIIKEVTKYVAILAIIATMIGWLMFLFSAWSDEKVKKAKNVIIYSIIWVLVSIASFTLVDIINNLTLN